MTKGERKGLCPQSRVSMPCQNPITTHVVKARELKISQSFIHEKSSISLHKTDIGALVFSKQGGVLVKITQKTVLYTYYIDEPVKPIDQTVDQNYEFLT